MKTIWLNIIVFILLFISCTNENKEKAGNKSVSDTGKVIQDLTRQIAENTSNPELYNKLKEIKERK